MKTDRQKLGAIPGSGMAKKAGRKLMTRKRKTKSRLDQIMMEMGKGNKRKR